MKRQARKRSISSAPSPGAEPRTVARMLTDEDRAALLSISKSGLFTLDASRSMYAGVRRLRPFSDENATKMDDKP